MSEPSRAPHLPTPVFVRRALIVGVVGVAGALAVLYTRLLANTMRGVLAAKMAVGHHLDGDRVEAARTRSVRVRTDRVMPFTADGEPFSSDDVDFRVLPGVLRMVVAGEADR